MTYSRYCYFLVPNKYEHLSHICWIPVKSIFTNCYINQGVVIIFRQI